MCSLLKSYDAFEHGFIVVAIHHQALQGSSTASSQQMSAGGASCWTSAMQMRQMSFHVFCRSLQAHHNPCCGLQATTMRLKPLAPSQAQRCVSEAVHPVQISLGKVCEAQASVQSRLATVLLLLHQSCRREECRPCPSHSHLSRLALRHLQCNKYTIFRIRISPCDSGLLRWHSLQADAGGAPTLLENVMREKHPSGSSALSMYLAECCRAWL